MKQISPVRQYYRPTLIPQLLCLNHAPILRLFSAFLRVLRASAVKKTRRWRLVEVNAIGTGTGTSQVQLVSSIRLLTPSRSFMISSWFGCVPRALSNAFRASW